MGKEKGPTTGSAPAGGSGGGGTSRGSLHGPYLIGIIIIVVVLALALVIFLLYKRRKRLQEALKKLKQQLHGHRNITP